MDSGLSLKTGGRISDLTMQIEFEASSILEKLGRLLNQRQIEAYLVGGLIRDALLGRSTADIDVAIVGDALQVASDIAPEIQGRYVLLDEANRIARVVLFHSDDSSSAASVNDMSALDKVPEGSSTGKNWYIDFSTLAGDIYLDLSRRDFTINAMAVNLHAWLESSGKTDIIDPFHAQQDLHQRCIKAVNNSIFVADPARLLRAERLSIELGFSIAEETEELVRRDSNLITGVAGERIREELLKILITSKSGESMIHLDKLGLLTCIFPELESARGVEQPVEHHWDVLNHSLETVRAVEFLLRQNQWEYAAETVLEDIPWSEKLKDHFASGVGSGSTHASLLKLGALLHDISKPDTKILDNDRVRFFGHSEQGAKVASDILERLRFSKKEIKLIETMVRYHLRPTQMSHEGLPTRRAIYRYLRDTGSAAIDILFLSLADHLAARGPDLDMAQWKWHVEQVQCILADCYRQETIISPPKLIDGHDIMRIFGLKPGPEIREILESVKEAQASGELSTREEALYYVKNRLLYRKQNLS